MEKGSELHFRIEKTHTRLCANAAYSRSLPHFRFTLCQVKALETSSIPGIFFFYFSINTYSAMGKFSRQHINDIFSYFPKKIGSDTSCKLSPWETICMKHQILFSRTLHANCLLGRQLA